MRSAPRYKIFETLTEDSSEASMNAKETLSKARSNTWALGLG